LPCSKTARGYEASAFGEEQTLRFAAMKRADGAQRIRKIRFWDKNIAHKTLFQLRGDGKVNERKLTVKRDLAFPAAKEEMQLAAKRLTDEELRRAV
jgi:hypothetical protein